MSKRKSDVSLPFSKQPKVQSETVDSRWCPTRVWQTRLNNIFKNLEIVLMGFKSRRITDPVWTDIVHAYNLMSDETITLEDISSIMTVYPETYIVQWKKSANQTDTHVLALSMNVGSDSALELDSRRNTFW